MNLKPEVALIGSKDFTNDWGTFCSENGFVVTKVEAIKTILLPSDKIDKAIDRLNDFTDIILTSRIAANIFVNRISEKKIDRTIFNNISFYAIGKSTAKILKQVKDNTIVPEESNAEGLLKVIGNPDMRRFLLPRSEKARDVLENALGSKLCIVPVYRIEYGNLASFFEKWKQIKNGIIVIGSSSSFQHLLNECRRLNIEANTFTQTSKFIAIGKITAEIMIKSNITPMILPAPAKEELLKIADKLANTI